MPIKIQSDLPVKEILEKENIIKDTIIDPFSESAIDSFP